MSGTGRTGAIPGGGAAAHLMSSAGAKLFGFLLLLAVIFTAAHAAGAHLGPVTTSYAHSGGGHGGGAGGGSGGGSGSMNMGGMP
jgi:hypothetical protein